MYKINDRKGRLIILDIFYKDVITKYGNKKKYKKCLCKCDCGREKEILYQNIISNVVSCGCYKKDQNKEQGLLKIKLTDNLTRQIKYLYAQHKSNCKYINKLNNISIEDYGKLVFSNCHYCNSNPSNLVKNKKYGGPFFYNGLDRINSDLDYSIENCVTCCIKCNRAKNNMTYDEFKNWVKSIYSFFIK